ncbi:hypothetical protein [Pseudonocardia sp. HH130629-09]|uniref:hypothetical protein n=1 Tax=Pseudonocardia sp. HH130629-09 TaxID=1641402 RepID=UPI0006CB2430|nr:hypothetical protein [Pseudonocardia sp. HH130629-09]ALE82344.1 hypothetical protein XF36_03660 [Pseudonocardia sp. HH130629-09]
MALTAAESERAGGPLAALSGAAGETDLLVVRDDPAPVRRPLTPAQARELLAADDDTDDDTEDGTGAAPVVMLPVERVRVHRLGLRWAVQDGDEADLVAALSELVGFDPDDDTWCVAPAAAGPVSDPEIEVVRRAVRRVARVYGLPVLPYRPLGPVAEELTEDITRDITEPEALPSAV